MPFNGCRPPDRKICRTATHHFAASLIVETLQPRSWHEWAKSAADTLGLIPGLNIPAEIVGGSLALYEGDWIGFGLSLIGLLPIGGECAVMLKIVRRARKAAMAARFGARVGRRARRMAQRSTSPKFRRPPPPARPLSSPAKHRPTNRPIHKHPTHRTGSRPISGRAHSPHPSHYPSTQARKQA